MRLITLKIRTEFGDTIQINQWKDSLVLLLLESGNDVLDCCRFSVENDVWMSRQEAIDFLRQLSEFDPTDSCECAPFGLCPELGVPDGPNV
jgi:hypothetical protein